MSDVIIKKVNPEDWNEVRDLRARGVRENPTAFGQTSDEVLGTDPNDWKEKLQQENYFIAMLDNRSAGIAYYVQEKRKKLRHSASIHGLYVVPEYRRQGVAKELVSRLIADMRTHPEIVKVSLYVSVAQPGAIALYKSLGFKDVALLEKELNVDGVYFDEYLMVKFIA